MKPLEGKTILDLTNVLAGPFCTYQLVNLGAEVIKIEQSGIGDPMRYLGTQKGGVSALFANCNRGKRSIDLNLKEKDDLEIAQKNKYQKLINLLDIKDGNKVLEIGCGWGGFSEYLAKNYNVSIDCITISKKLHCHISQD